MSDQQHDEGGRVRRGLAGVVADTTAISMVNPETNSLLYRGYPVQELAASCSFEDVAYLLWNGELPGPGQRDGFVAFERSRRPLPEGLLASLATLPTSCHPMDVLRSAVSILGASDPAEDDASPEANLAKSVDLLAKLPAIVAAEQRRRRGEGPIPPDPSLSIAENFFHMCFGEIPEPEIVRCFEISLVLYAEHSFNASTFTARVIASTLSDLHSAVTGAIGALKGPLHGGANEAVMAMLEAIGTADRAESWLAEALAAKVKIMGFGHRVYKHGDSRVPTMETALRDLADRRGARELIDLYDRLGAAMMREKNIHPNLDYPTGPAYHLMGFDIPTFTPIFVMARITGWTAHVMEQLANNALIRPLSSYVGPPQRAVPTGRA
ncbi:MAG: bifunctional 2-methylcitrate synthase/citrate synthase [Actinomycetota bacterium]|nr:bifunctional 2-methylcitrate synthase/citrate synthase [Actinomycetota bacterium]